MTLDRHQLYVLKGSKVLVKYVNPAISHDCLPSAIVQRLDNRRLVEVPLNIIEEIGTADLRYR